MNSTFDNTDAFEFLNCLKVKNIINSAGLYSREIALNIKGLNKSQIPKINLIKGDYFKIQGVSPFKRLIYPLPTKYGLGIHSTLTFRNEIIFSQLRKINT